MKKILICSTKGGGGHIIVSEALAHYLKANYCVETISIFDDTLSSLDLIKFLSFGTYNWIQLYDDLIVHKYFKTLNICKTLGAWYLRLRHKSLVKIITSYLQEHKPDIVISVVPLINAALIHATKNLNIPFCVVPTDLDSSMFIYGIKAPDHQRFIFSFSFEDKAIKSIINRAHLPENQSTSIGFPVRPEFLEATNFEKIKEQHDIPDGKPIILILMGYQGSQALYAFAQELSKLTIPIHLIFCTGKDEKIAEKIRSIQFLSHITISIIGFTNQISQLMAIADLLIAKSGSVSVCEALYMNLPIFLDATTGVLQWERFNHKFVTKHHFGESIKKLDKLTPMVHKFLTDQGYRMRMKHNIKKLEKKRPGKEICDLIAHMLPD
jgi:UDP-N-acetylglucosamine:LPS N-acetylglucosamine transferase